jgi:hypothetical protein
MRGIYLRIMVCSVITGLVGGLILTSTKKEGPTEFPAPEDIRHVYDGGIAWDGEYLWVPCRNPAGPGSYLGARQIDPDTGKLTGRALADISYSVCAIAMDRENGILWHLAYPSGPIFGVDINSGATVTAFRPGVSWLHDIAFDGEHLWATKDDGRVYRFDPKTGQCLGCFLGPGGISNPHGGCCNLGGITHDGRYFWFSRRVPDTDIIRLYRVDPEIALSDGKSDHAILDYLDMPFGSELASDGKSLWTCYYDHDIDCRVLCKIEPPKK